MTVVDEGKVDTARFVIHWVDDDETGLSLKLFPHDPSGSQFWTTIPLDGEPSYTVVTQDLDSAQEALKLVAIWLDKGYAEAAVQAKVDADVKGWVERKAQIEEEAALIDQRLADAVKNGKISEVPVIAVAEVVE